MDVQGTEVPRVHYTVRTVKVQLPPDGAGPPDKIRIFLNRLTRQAFESTGESFWRTIILCKFLAHRILGVWETKGDAKFIHCTYKFERTIDTLTARTATFLSSVYQETCTVNPALCGDPNELLWS